MTDVSAENKPKQTVRLRYFAAVAEAAGVKRRVDCLGFHVGATADFVGRVPRR